MPPSYDFVLDRFQVEAIAALDAGRSVLVAAPTGSGKTVVAEHAVALALAQGRRIFYTTPIKALSNQKFGDLVRRYGSARVGLLTGDNAINGDAPVVVMTTEVLRNMIYAGSPGLDELAWVVLDEVHYLQDAYRGPVWEEVIIHAPPQVRLVCLSATVSNAQELADWIALVRGSCDVVVETERPVRLEHLFMAADRGVGAAPRDPHPGGRSAEPRGPPLRGRRCPDRRPAAGVRAGPGCASPRPAESTWWRSCAGRDLVPALYFIFSRAACDDAVLRLPHRRGAPDHAGRAGTGPGHRRRAHPQPLRRATSTCWATAAGSAGLEAGVAAHHAGMVPPFKEAVEACFSRGAGQGGLRHRDAGARGQHAGPHGGDREADQVQR